MPEVFGRAPVPCGTCRLCCSMLPVPLRPEHDDVSAYDHTMVERNGQQVAFLRKHEGGACVYLNDNGCSIWERAPFACRYFDCRTYFHLAHSGLKPNNNEQSILARGRELMEQDLGRVPSRRR